MAHGLSLCPGAVDDELRDLLIRRDDGDDGGKRCVLLIGNDAALAERLKIEGYEVIVARRSERAVEILERDEIDCLLLDLAASGRSGFDVLRELRAFGNDLPIILLVRRNRSADGVLGLRLGADDYVRKPIDVEELLARLEAVLRRWARRADDTCATHGAIRVNFRTAEVARDGMPVCLSALEMELLRYLIEHRGEVLTREELLENVWGYGALPVTRTVDVRISSLRRKLELDPARPELIHTIHGIGYKFDDSYNRYKEIAFR